GSHRVGRLALTGGLSVAAAAALAVAVLLPAQQPRVARGTLGTARSAKAVRELAYRVATAAAARPQVRPGQWVYWKEASSYGQPQHLGRHGAAPPPRPRSFETWT